MKITSTNNFFYSTSLILGIAGISKIVSAFGSAKVLWVPDPIFGTAFRQLFWFVGCLELAVSVVCLFEKNMKLKAVLVAWIATSIAIYRLGLLWVGYHKPACPCLGSLTDALHISPETADTTMKIILVYLLIGSYATLFWLWRQRKKAISVSLPAQ